jgi:hypothetical protein
MREIETTLTFRLRAPGRQPVRSDHFAVYYIPALRKVGCSAVLERRLRVPREKGEKECRGQGTLVGFPSRVRDRQPLRGDDPEGRAVAEARCTSTTTRRETVLKKYSYPTRPITLTAEVPTWGLEMTDDIVEAGIRRTTELVGDVPFDWMTLETRPTFAVFFGLETWELALAAQARLQASNFDTHVWDEGVEDQVLGKLLRQAGRGV